MITFIKQNMLLAVVATLFVCVVVYYGFFRGKGDTELLATIEGAAPSAQSQELLVVLANLNTIQLNDAVFRDPVFLSLNDFSVTIAPQTVGRRNPFAPTSVRVQTNIPTPSTAPRVTPAP